jgi:hypothetical protein
MRTDFDVLRELIKEIDAQFNDVSLGGILKSIVDEIEKLSNEFHQGYTKPE